jgi:ABC-type Fe3+/spermidine/putrescine transport system ATPase subunit
VVRIEDVTVTWPEFQLNATLEASKGEVLSILGPSGSGKTTTLRIIAGFAEPERGRVWIGEREVTNLSPAHRKIGFVFQDYTLFPHMNVFENVAYGLHVQRVPREEQEERVREYLQLVGLPGYQGRRVETLSGGERQRVAVARALVVEPEVLLLDEPFSSIDAPLRKDLGAQLLRLQQALGITILFVTHSRSEALSISHKVAVMREGHILQVGTPEELYERPVNRFVASFVGPASFFTGILRGDESSPWEGATTEGPPPEGAPSEGAPSEDVLFESDALEAPIRIASEKLREPPFEGETTIMLRPGSLELAETPGEGASAQPVRIVSRQFFGHYFEYECRLSTGEPLLVFDAARHEVGTRCYALVSRDAPVCLGR